MILSHHAVEFKDPDRKDYLLAFSTRRGGVSPIPLDSLNLSISQGDSAENVSANLEIFSKSVCFPTSGLVELSQVHKDDIIIIDSVPNKKLEADSMITAVPGLFLSIKTADCLPALLYARDKNVIGAVHAGWGGAALKICSKTVAVMEREFNVAPKDVTAVLGPCIRPCCYEIDEKVIEPFKKSFSNYEDFIKPLSVWKATSAVQTGLQGNMPEEESQRLDLAGAVTTDLLNAGLLPENIHDTNLCASCREDLFFSHRRDKGNTGRQMSVIGIKS